MKKIKYSDVMSLGFKEQENADESYFNEYGYPYCIITKDLTKKIYLDWAKETQLCELVRMDSPKTCNIKKRVQIKSLKQLKEIVEFFKD